MPVPFLRGMDKQDVVHADDGMRIPQKQNGVHRQVVDTIPERLFCFQLWGTLGEKTTKTGNGARWGEGGGRRSRGSRPTLAS